LSPCAESKKQHTQGVFKAKVSKDLFVDSDKEPEGTASAEQQALADAKEKFAAADLQRIGISGKMLAGKMPNMSHAASSDASAATL
jgi:hypothetical protein